MKQALVMWLRADPDAVKRYMDENEVPPEVVDTVRGQEQLGGKKLIPEAKTDGASS
jgi:hypothetical protein